MSRDPLPVVIVMIEDDEAHARLIEKNIRRAGVSNEIVTFRDGRSTIEFLTGTGEAGRSREGRALLFLLDLNLPDMSGLDLLARIKADEETRRAPVIVLATTDDQRDIRRCYDLGANVYITKPLSYESFAAAVRQLGLFVSVMQVPEVE